MTSAWQQATRIPAWAFLAGAYAADLAGYALRGLVSIPVGLSADGNAKLAALWNPETRRNFRAFATAQHFLWNIGAIAPSDTAIEHITRNSLDEVDAQRLSKLGDYCPVWRACPDNKDTRQR